MELEDSFDWGWIGSGSLLTNIRYDHEDIIGEEPLEIAKNQSLV